ncbi:Crp/Fnr family transcriptional regulator [Virgibacillus kimchii]
MRTSPAVNLANFEFLSHFSEEEIAELKTSLFERTYKKNQLLFTEGDPRERIFLLADGYVKLEKTNRDANMLYINYINPNDFFPYVGLFNEDFYRYSAYAVTDIHVYYVPTKKFESIIPQKNEMLLHIIKRLDLLTKRHQDRLQTVSTPLATDRVEQSISYLFQNFSTKIEKDYHIDIPVTMVEMAQIAGTSRETVSHVYKTLKEDQVISLNGKKIIVHDADYFIGKCV